MANEISSQGFDWNCASFQLWPHFFHFPNSLIMMTLCIWEANIINQRKPLKCSGHCQIESNVNGGELWPPNWKSNPNRKHMLGPSSGAGLDSYQGAVVRMELLASQIKARQKSDASASKTAASAASSHLLLAVGQSIRILDQRWSDFGDRDKQKFSPCQFVWSHRKFLYIYVKASVRSRCGFISCKGSYFTVEEVTVS